MFRRSVCAQLSRLLAHAIKSNSLPAETAVITRDSSGLLRCWEQSVLINSSWQTQLYRPYSGSAGDGSKLGDDKTPTSTSGASSDISITSERDATLSLQAIDNALAEWGDAMDDGDWEKAWDIFETQFPVDNGEFPALEDILAWDPDEEEKLQRRQRERSIQEEYARARVQRLDAYGRAHAVGKRKTSIARVWIKPGNGLIMINRRPFDQYFPVLPRRNDLITPLLVTGLIGQFDVMAAVQGGGLTGQSQALRHGLARALQLWDPNLRSELKTAGLLTRDSRIVERKKPGRKKARKAFQWVKR